MRKSKPKLAELEPKLAELEDRSWKKYTLRIVSEPPTFRLIRYRGLVWRVPIPWTHYLMVKSNRNMKRQWWLFSMYMSPRHLTNIRFREVSRPIVSNLFDCRPFFKPCQADGIVSTDINRLIVNFWDGEFNGDLKPHGHPVVSQIAGRATPFTNNYFMNWEQLSIDELLAFNWPQDIRI